MPPSRHRLLLACALLPAFAANAAPPVAGTDAGAPAHAHSPRQGGCETFTWDVSRELAAMKGPPVAVVAGRNASGSARIEPGKRHDVALHPQSGVHLLAEPPKHPPEGATAGLVVFQVQARAATGSPSPRATGPTSTTPARPSPPSHTRAAPAALRCAR